MLCTFILLQFTVHYMDRGQGRPVKSLGRLMGPVGVVIIVAPVHHISWAAIRAGLRNYVGHLMGWAERHMRSSHVKGRGTARLIKFSKFSVRPGLVHLMFIILGLARPGPLYLQIVGPARPITCSKFSARPGPAHDNFHVDRIFSLPLQYNDYAPFFLELDR